MGFKTFVAGSVHTASDVNTYLMQQAVIVCTAATRPSSPIEGMVIYETDTDEFNAYNGSAWVEFSRTSAWTSYTPSWTNLSVGDGLQDAYWLQWGKLVIVRGSVVLGASSSITGTISHTLPAAAKNLTGSGGRQIGVASYEDTATRFYGGSCSVADNSSTLNFHHTDAGNSGNVNATTPFTFGTNDGIYWQITYEAA